MKQTLIIVLALTSYIVLILTSLNVLAVIGCAFVVLLTLGLTSKVITAIIESKRYHHTVTYWKAN